METTDTNKMVSQYLEMAARRKWWMIIPFLVTLLGGLAFALVAPRIYEAETLILVQPQKVPEDYVRSLVPGGVEDRLRTITQQVTSRTNLERIMQQFHLFGDKEGSLPVDRKVELLRKWIKIEVGHRSRRRDEETNSFTIKFRYEDPKKAMEVTNALASNFISENLKIRESQAIGTSTFLADELSSVKRRLVEKEKELKDYRTRYMGGLPEQLQTNLSILERLQTQLDQSTESLRDAENRRVMLQKEIAEGENPATQPLMLSPGAVAGNAQRTTDLASLKNELATLESRYTENHPDVIRLRETIARLEASQAGQSGPDQQGPPLNPVVSRLLQTLRKQLVDVELEIKRLKAEVSNTQAQIVWYQKKVEETPKREQELLSLNRDYENLKDVYNSLLNRKLEAEIAVSLEKKQKGEQFRILDPAKEPSFPVKPDMKKVALLTLVLALGLGGGLAFLVETMDTSFKNPEELEKELKLPILATMPIRYTERELKRMKIKKALAYAGVGIGFACSALAIVLAAKGVDKTMTYIHQVMEKM